MVRTFNIGDTNMAKNTGLGRRIGAVADRVQRYNPVSGKWDKFTRDGHYLKTKSDGSPWKGIPKL